MAQHFNHCVQITMLYFEFDNTSMKVLRGAHGHDDSRRIYAIIF